MLTNTIWGKYSADIFKQIAGRSGNGLKKRECKKGAVCIVQRPLFVYYRMQTMDLRPEIEIGYYQSGLPAHLKKELKE